MAWIERHSPDVVGFDAPLVVTNPTGRRACEALVSRAFAAQRAGCYPSNTGMAPFADGGRAMALARRLDLEVDPRRARRRRVGLAVEVFPHSALVALFGLDVRLAYKAGRGRDVGVRRAEMGRLVALVEELGRREVALDATAGPRWALLRSAVQGAVRHADLELVEDELDAHVCAYVARCLAADLVDGGDRVAVLGRWTEGAIVTPLDQRHLSLLTPYLVETR